MTIGQAPGDRRDHHQRGWPGRYQHTDLDRRQTADVLEVERQRHERNQLCRVCADRGGNGKCEHRAPEQVDRQHRRGQRVLTLHEEPTDSHADRELQQHGRQPLAAPDAIQRGDEQSERDRIQHRAHRIEWMAGARRWRQEPMREPQREHAGGHL